MSDESIFDLNTSGTPEDIKPATEAPSIPQELVELVGEGKKYRSIEDALKSVPHAQSHIKKLEEELKQMQEELTKRKTAEELLDSFKSVSPQKEETPPVGLNQDDLVRTVEAVLTKAEQKKTEQTNINSVINTFNQMYGEKGAEMYKKVAEESGLPVTSLNKLAASSPAAVFKLAGIDGKSKESVPGKPSSSVNTQGLPSTQSQQTLSAKLPKGATTKDLVNAWKNAGETVKKNLGIN